MVKKINYDEIRERAKTYIVRDALSHVQMHGLGDATHFYITFKTSWAGVKIPDFLKARYPDVITIVLQHSFSNLNVSDTGFGVNLSFNGQPFYIIVPFAALVEFKDPSENFVLGFVPSESANDEGADQPLPFDAIDNTPRADNIIDLSAFRKK